jgi:hypothetical protein
MPSFYPPQHSSRNGVVQTIQDTGNNTSVATSNFGTETFQIRIASPKAGYYRVDASAAVVGDSYLPAAWVEYVKVTPGQNLAWISTSTSTGTITITELS